MKKPPNKTRSLLDQLAPKNNGKEGPRAKPSPLDDDPRFENKGFCEAYEASLRDRPLPLFGKIALGAIVKERRGKLVWRIPGKRGADLDRPPLAVECDALERAYFTEIAKGEREARIILANISGKNSEAQIQKGEHTKSKVLELWNSSTLPKHKRTADIVHKLDGAISAKHIRRIVRESKNRT